MIYVSYKKISKNIYEKLLNIELRNDVAQFLSEGICQNSLRGIDSHGIRLFPHYLEGFKQGRLNKNPNYKKNNEKINRKNKRKNINKSKTNQNLIKI